MQDKSDLPSTETENTPQPTPGENIKHLVTPGDDASEEAAAETAEPDLDAPNAGAGKDDVARPDEAEEAQSPT